MKLNLLPTSVSREKSNKRAWLIMAVLAIGSILVSVMLIVNSSKALRDAKNDVVPVKSAADAAVQRSDQADTIMALAVPYVRNVSLVQAIDAHVNVYPKFYAQIKPYLPSFFRITSLRATPMDAQNVLVSLTGVIKNQTTYNDLMFALERIPGASPPARSSIPTDPEIVPNLTPDDLTGRIHKVSEPTIPDDSDARLNLFISRGSVSGYDAAGNFGVIGPAVTKGAMPTWNLVTVTFMMPGDLQAPNIRDTLSKTTSAPAAAGATGFGGGPAGAPAGPPARAVPGQ